MASTIHRGAHLTDALLLVWKQECLWGKGWSGCFFLLQTVSSWSVFVTCTLVVPLQILILCMNEDWPRQISTKMQITNTQWDQNGWWPWSSHCTVVLAPVFIVNADSIYHQPVLSVVNVHWNCLLSQTSLQCASHVLGLLYGLLKGLILSFWPRYCYQ